MLQPRDIVIKRTMFIDTDVYRDLCNDKLEPGEDIILRQSPLPGTRKVEVKIKRL